jgi:O-antigen/teichoic acid export membrane protein
MLKPLIDRIDNTTSSGMLERRLYKNSALIMTCRMVSMSVSVISVPFVIRSLGFQGYGTWETIMAVSVVAAIPQNVIGATLLWKMSSAFGVGDSQEIVRLARLGVSVALLMFGLFLPPIWMCRRPLVRMLNIPSSFGPAAEWILPSVVALVLLGGINESLGAVIRGCQHTGLSTVIQTVASVFNATGIIGALFLGTGLWSMLIGFALSFLTTVYGFRFLASRLCPGITLRPAQPRTSDIKNVRKYVGCLVLGSLSASLRVETDKIVLASLASPTWTGYYGFAARLVSLVMEVSNFFYVPAMAAVGALHARNDWPGIRSLYSNLMMVVPAAAGAIVIVIAGFPRHLMILWIGRDVPQAVTLLGILLCGYAPAVILTGPGTCVCKGIGRIEIETVYIAVSLVLNLVLTIALVRIVGPTGTVIATAVSWAVGSLFFAFYLHPRLPLRTAATMRAGRALIAILAVILLIRFCSPYLTLPTDRMGALRSVFALLPVALALYAAALLLTGVVPVDALRLCVGPRYKDLPRL